MTPERQTNHEDLNEAHRLISAANEAIESLELSFRRELHHLKDALLDLSGTLIVISHKVDAERKEREKG